MIRSVTSVLSVAIRAARRPLVRRAALVLVGGALLYADPSAQIVGSGTLNTPRWGHTATPLADGRVLIVGGQNQGGLVTLTEIFNPATGSVDPGPAAVVPRTGHTATSLPDGRVLIAGGTGAEGPLASTEFFDPAANMFVAGPSMGGARAGHTATMFTGNVVLMVGGDTAGSAEYYDIGAGSFVGVPAFLNTPRSGHSAILLQSGGVLIVGGADSTGTLLTQAELFDATAMTFWETFGSSQVARFRPWLNMLPDGKVQVIGGDQAFTMEMFNPNIEFFRAVANLPPTADLLAATLATPDRAALFSKAIATHPKLAGRLAPELQTLLDREGHVIVELPGRSQAFVSGGVNNAGEVLASASLLASSPATITTDWLDYPPFGTVIMTGRGFQPGETVTLMIHGEPVVDGYPDPVLTITADADGIFTTMDFSPQEADLGRSLVVTAIGQASGLVAQTAFSDGGNLDYSPRTQAPSVTRGSAVDFSQTVTAPKNNGSFTASLQVAGTGTNPIPAAWVSTAPTSLSFNTTSSAGDSKSWVVTLTVPTGAAAGSYTANIKANPSITGVGAGSGTTVTLTVTGKSDQTITVTTAPPTSAVYNSTFGVAATASSGLAVAITATGVCSGSGSGSATLTMTSGTGTCRVHYNQAGDDSYKAAPEVTSDTTAVKANAHITVTPYSVTYDGNPHGATGTATGVKAEDLSSLLHLGDSFTNVQGGSAHWTFDGNTNYKATSGDVAITIAQAESMVIVTCPASVIYNGTAQTPCTAQAKGVAMNPVNVGASLTYTNNTNPGTATATAAWAGDANHTSSIGTGSFAIGYGVCSATVGAGGVILPPINSDGTSVYNRKGGSTIPVKFRVCDASGGSISNAGAVFTTSSGSVTMLNAVRGTVTVVNEDTVAEIPDVAFRWDASGQQWIFNMATMNLGAGTTYTFRINLAYGPASIQFRVGVR